MRLNFKELIKMSFDQVLKVLNPIRDLLSDDKVTFSTRIIGSILIISSGALLYLDKILMLLKIDSSITYGFSSFYNFIWVLMQSVAPIFIIIIGAYLKPYKSSYLVPIYCYAVQIIWIFNSEYADDFLLTAKYSFGLVILILTLIVILKKMIKLFHIKKNEDEEFIEETKEVLELLKAKIITNNS